MKNIRLVFTQFIKMILYYTVIPLMFFLHKGKQIDDNLVLFADAHNDQIPSSMRLIYDKVQSMNYTVINHCHDYRDKGLFAKLRLIREFLKHYAQAKYVFVQDTFLPIAACGKKKGTMVIQLWHGCGLLKKIGFDIKGNVEIKFLNPFNNYDLVTVSAEACIPVFQRMMKLKPETAQATGVSRTDRYFDKDYQAQCEKDFTRLHPDAIGKKVIVWAPTFRGNAKAPLLDFVNEVVGSFDKLPNECYPIIKLHPHIKQQTKFNSTLKVEQLLPVAHVFITDFSSLLFEYLLQEREKQLVLYTPDFDQYVLERGLYIAYDSIPGIHTKTIAELERAITAHHPLIDAEVSAFVKRYMGACNGTATDNILNICDFKN